MCSYAGTELEQPTLGEANEKIELLSNKGEDANPTVLQAWKDIAAVIKQTQASNAKKTFYSNSIEQAPTDLEAIRQNIKSLSLQAEREVDRSLDLSASISQMREGAAELNGVKAELNSLIEQEEKRNNRELAIPDILAEQNAKLVNLGGFTKPNSISDELTVAQYYLSVAQLAAAKADVEMLDIEQEYNQTMKAVSDARKQLANTKLKKLSTYVDKLQAYITSKSKEESIAVQDKAKALAERYQNIPQLADYAAEIAYYAALRNDLLQQQVEANRHELSISKQLRVTREQYVGAKNRIQLIEDSNLKIDTEMGSLLRMQRKKLQTPKQLTEKLEKNLIRVTTLQLEQMKHGDILEAIPIDTGATTRGIVGESAELTESRQEIAEMLETHRKTVQQAYLEYDKLIAALNRSNYVTREAIYEIKNYSRYLDERLLWIASAPIISLNDVNAESIAIKKLLTEDVPQWLKSIGEDIRGRFLLWLAAAALLILVMLRRKRYWAVLVLTAKGADKKSFTRLAPMWQSLWVSFLLMLPLPLIAGFLAWRGDTPASISAGFKAAAFFFAIIGSMRILLHRHGLLAIHLGLKEEKRSLLLKNFRWLFFIMPLLLVLSTALIVQSSSNEAGRLVFIVMMMVAMTFAHCVLLPSKGLFQNDKGTQLFQKTLYAIGVGIPVLFIVGVCMGYITSVQTIRMQVIGTFLVVIVSYFISKLCLRTVLLLRRRVAKEQAKKKYKVRMAALKNDPAEENTSTQLSLEEIEAEAVNIVAVEEQTKRMVRVAMVLLIVFTTWSIWSSSLLALSKLDDIKFGQNKAQSTEVAPVSTNSISQTLTGSASSTDETATDSSNSTNSDSLVDVRVSLKDILKALILIGITIAFARNLPGLLDLVILRRLNLQPGGSYAVTTILRYAIVLIGILLIFGALGITWSSVQWLAAAVTLGIGFGLQEIFANFVAGIILLFERPVRLGDIVSVGEYSGHITQINIRATTIKQFNNREVVVPNKDFITNQLVNWTLTDSVLRFEFYVGIAYGSETEKASRIISETMSDNPNVLKTHSTDVYFSAFGNSTLDFRVRGYVRSPEHLIQIPSELHFEIDKRFREAEIEIAFPQTDIHIRSLPEGFNIQQAIKTADDDVKSEG
ncbi:MAG: mechanosensitive ion channel domain-containing protein [Akkermansiaceae bacterium]